MALESVVAENVPAMAKHLRPTPKIQTYAGVKLGHTLRKNIYIKKPM